MFFYVALFLIFLLLLSIYYRNAEKPEFIGITREEAQAFFNGEEKEEEYTVYPDEEYIPYQGKKSKGEKECCRVLEKIFSKPFYTVRPNFLKNPETGKNLELDCFNPEVKVAVEYNGKQHYTFPNFTGMSRQKFFDQLRRDRFKKERCLERGIELIIVPYTVPLEKIEEYILEKLTK